MATGISPGCPFGSDNQFVPQISIDCRPFDFTLLFEDIFFTCLPASVFLLLFPSRLYYLRTHSVKVDSYKYALRKLSTITILFILHIVFTAFQVKASALHTQASLPSAALNIVATFAAACVSLLEDQRSLKPSDLLILYFSASSLCSLPRLRSLWMIPSASVQVCRYLWLSIFIVTVVVLFVESTPKRKILKPHYRSTPEEQTCGFWTRSFFGWILPFLQRGYSNIIQVEDIDEVDTSLQGQESGEKLQGAWKSLQPNCNRHHQLLKATFYAYRWAFFSAVLPRLALSAFTFAQPFLITATIDYIGSPSAPKSKLTGQALIGAYILVYVGLAVSKAVYWRQTFRLLTKIRSGLISMIYKQTVGMNANALTDSAAVTLMGTDTERIVSNLRNLHETWASIIEIGVSIWLLQRQVWIACIIPLIISLGSTLAMVPVSTRSGQAQKQWIERVQERLAVTSSMLDNMKAVQMLGIRDVLFEIVSRLRKVEVATSVRFRKLLIWQVALSNVPGTLAPFLTFTIYAIIAVVRHNEGIVSAKAFTTLALVSLLTDPLLIFCQAMPAILQAAACFSRVEEYCLKDSVMLSDPSTPARASEDTSQEDMKPQPSEVVNAFEAPLIAFKSADISWSPETEPTLRNLNLSIRRGRITMIIGSVGSGKSILLESMVNRNMVTKGTVTTSFSKLAYCPQIPWIRNDTIKSNIIGASELEFDQKWYDFTTLASGLEEDLKTIPEGDMHMAGSDGCSLSGGQKQRVALARAVYSKLEVVVLDDSFSGLDPNSIALISNRLFSKEGYFRKTGRSVILATTTYQMLPYADEVIILDQGQITAIGSYDEIIAQKPDIALKPQTIVKYHPSPHLLVETTSEQHQLTLDKEKVPTHTHETKQIDNEQSKHIRRQGSWSVYGYYFQNAGYVLLFFFLVFAMIEAFCTSFQTLWMQWWVEANEEQMNQQLGMYLGAYGMIFGLTLLAVVAGCWLLFVRILNNTSLNLHSDLLKSTLGAPISFFQSIDTGSMINRFSQDLELIDMMLPIYAVNFVMSFLTVFINTIIICALGKYLGSSIPLLGLVLFLLQSYYLRTSRQVRLLDIEAKAPLYAHFLETVRGISSIRAFGWEWQFCKESQYLLNRSQRPMYMLFCIQQWLTLVLDLVVGVIAVLLIVTIVSLTDQFNTAPIGVALTLLLTLNQTLAQAIKMWTMTETSIGAVTRIQRFIEETPSMGRHESSSPPPPNWSPRGAVDFHDVTASYGLPTNPVIKNLTLTIQPGEKIAICGASGSGKTSLLMAMLQMLEIHSGHITIDDRDIIEIEQGALIHSAINVIPQDPFFLPGPTLRFNLDPHQRVSDQCLISAIDMVGLRGLIGPMGGGLDMIFNPSDWSVGQKQLLSLARALVVKNKHLILVLDEATSSVDPETESIMQSIVEKEFSHQTVIAVIHRFRYIDRFDRVAVLRHGELVEVDKPDVLLRRENSEFRKLYSKDTECFVE